MTVLDEIGHHPVAELRYEFDGSVWSALVTLGTDDATGSPCYQLWYRRGSSVRRSGQFQDGGRLAAYVRQAAAEKFDRDPVIDTLDKLKHRRAASAVPECYRVGSRMPKCGCCPYRNDCFLEAARVVPKGEGVSGLEPESVFLRRLRQKVRALGAGDGGKHE